MSQPVKVRVPGVAAVMALVVMASSAASAQRTVELGLDAGATFGLGDQSSVSISLPASRARAGFFQPGSAWSLEPAVGLSFAKVEGVEGVLFYEVEFGALYHLKPVVVASVDRNEIIARVPATYIRPFVGLTGYTGDEADNEVSLGAGLGIKVPWRQALSWRLEANLGYGLDNEALRIGALAGVSFFSR